MTDRVRIEVLDIHAADETALRARWEATTELVGELEPEEPIAPFDQHLVELRHEPSYRNPHHLVAWDGDGKHVVGYASITLEYTDSNRHLAWFDLGVRDAARGQGIATRLLHDIGEIARNDGRTIIGSWSVDGHPGSDFAQARGFAKKSTERKSRLETAKIDRELMDRWIKAAEASATDYELVAYDGRSPEELVDEFVDLYDVTNTAPRDDLDMEDEVMTREMFLENEERMEKVGTHRWLLLARHVPTGQLAGFTEFWFPKHTDTVTFQGWTAVRPDHRNHGLGRWLKAVNAVRLLDERPQVVAIDTWNAFSNGPMLGINIAMGFELLRGYNDWQAPTDQVVETTKEKSGLGTSASL